MITRIVRMEFRPEAVEAFLEIFSSTMGKIASFPGIIDLQLHRDTIQQNVFYTLSTWEDEIALEAYRESELFREVWPRTKSLFLAEREAQAYSLNRVEVAIG
jgi:(4S)-4-hydroxy-5-phosphonooxypentane-2,3-dione isomerase